MQPTTQQTKKPLLSLARLAGAGLCLTLLLAPVGAAQAQGRFFSLFFQRPTLVTGPPVVPGSAFADTADSPAAADFALLASLGIFRGDRGPVVGPAHPEATVSRAELAAIAVRMLGHEEAVGWYKEKEVPLPYSDVEDIPTWARGYAHMAANLGLVRGIGGRDGSEGRFAAAEPITLGQAVIVLGRALQIQASAGPWPDAAERAAHAAMEATVEKDRGDSISRAEMATLVSTAMKIGLYNNKTGKVDPEHTLLNDRFRTLTRQVEDVDRVERRIYLRAEDGAQAQRAWLATQVFLQGAPDLESLVGRRILAVVRDDEPFNGAIVYIEPR